MTAPSIDRLAHLAALSVLALGLARALAPCFSDLSTFGVHDWDSHAAYRYITVLSLLRYGQLPFWDPFSCGGFPSWGYVEGATNLVSPYLPAYLLLPIQVALRVELLGSAVAGLVGAYVLSSRFTRSVALRALVAVLFGLNGRWALQATAGHTWHLRYAFLPWLLFLFDRAVRPGELKWAAWAGALFALMIYMGGIYPAPQSALLLGLYGAALAVQKRSLRPLAAGAVIGATGFGLSAPKLLPILDTMQWFPRKTESPETLDLSQLTVMLTAPDQRLASRPIAVPLHAGWHEYGIYVGWAGVFVLVFGLLFSSGTRGNALKLAGAAGMTLAMGAFHDMAPWTLLHKLPIFSSQWVPTRFLYPAVLFLALAFADAAAKVIDGPISRRRALDLLLLCPVLLIAVDLSNAARGALHEAFTLVAPALPWSPEFHHEDVSPYHYKNPDLHADSILLPMFANVGVVHSYGTPLFSGGRSLGRRNPAYRGEVHVEDGGGEARITRFTPNEVTVEVDRATPGAVVVYNETWDGGWTAGGEQASTRDGLIAAPVPPGGKGTIVFRYYPRTLNRGLAFFGLTVALLAAAPRAIRGWRARLGAS